jgi:hypothetical protein
MTTVFFSYCHADEALRDQLERQLKILQRQGLIETWHDRRIEAGQEFAGEIDAHIEADEIILLLVSPDFLNSDYCYEVEMVRALERHEAREAIVIPVILRDCLWKGAPFGKILGVPTDGRPVTQWPDIDHAFRLVAEAVQAAAKRVGDVVAKPARSAVAAVGFKPEAAIRSSNLRIAKTFNDRDRDVFQTDAFEFMAKYFENSLSELAVRNSEIDGSFRRLDANRFSAVAYHEGQAVSRCTVFMGGRQIGGIAYTATENAETNGFNENLTVEADEQTLFLRSMGMAHFGQNRDEKLTFEGAAETYWQMFVKPLQ